MKRTLTLSLLLVFLSVLLASTTSAKPASDFLGTLYTVAGIMFSIGMGIICAINLEKVKNIKFYKAIKTNILQVRNIYLYYFAIISIGYLAYQLAPEFELAITIQGVAITFRLSLLVALLTVLSIVYFTLNFLAIQKLNFQITEKSNQ
ncbi:hypothetical protein [Neisseria sp.]